MGTTCCSIDRVEICRYEINTINLSSGCYVSFRVRQTRYNRGESDHGIHSPGHLR